MNSTTITIEKGNQYDADGYSMTDGITHSYGSKNNSSLGFSQNGNCWVGADYESYENEVDKAILATMQDGLTREITMAKKEDPQPIITDSNVCPKCGTYCYGDCEA